MCRVARRPRNFAFVGEYRGVFNQVLPAPVCVEYAYYGAALCTSHLQLAAALQGQRPYELPAASAVGRRRPWVQ